MSINKKKINKLISWNVNSIRVRLDHLNKLIESENPDIIFLQETRVTNDKYPIVDNYYNYYHGEVGRNGVAILSKDLCEILFISDRKIIAKIDDYILINVYVPCQYGEEKILFFDDLTKDIENFKDNNIILAGDFNVTHHENEIHSNFKDLYNENEKLFSKNLENLLINKATVGEFTWWDYRVPIYKKVGLGIDKFFVSSNVEMNNFCVLSTYRKLERPSDHAPILLSC